MTATGGIYWSGMPQGWSVGPWDSDHAAESFLDLAYRGSDLRAPTELEAGHAILEADPMRTGRR